MMQTNVFVKFYGCLPMKWNTECQPQVGPAAAWTVNI
jgi:hypothetical protein